jgi:indole-3-glycerol phosphate synthase
MSTGENILTRIMGERKKDVAVSKRQVSVNELLWEAEKRTNYYSLVDRLRGGAGPRIIAEVKKASPSAGELRQVYDPTAIAQAYVSAGAVGISVLTEPHHFLGSLDDLRRVRKVVNVPVLRKDFIGETYQLLEAAAWGADVVLLIVAALEPGHCEILYREAIELNLEVIVEVHTREELGVALSCEQAIIGVNSRDLKTLRTDLDVAYDLAKAIPDDRLCIAESGIRTPEDIAGLQAAGYDGFLVGESLLREPFPGKALKGLLGKG